MFYLFDLNYNRSTIIEFYKTMKLFFAVNNIKYGRTNEKLKKIT